MTDDRLERAFLDVIAVERQAPGLVKVVTWSDSYLVDAREAGCNCPDKQYNEPSRCKHDWGAIVAASDIPAPFTVTDSLDERVMTDGGREYPDKFEVVDHDNNNRKPAESMKGAEEKAATARQFGSSNVDILTPEENAVEADGGSDADEAQVVDEEPAPAPDTNHEPEVLSPEEVEEHASELDDRDVGTDPLTWMPGEFVDTIDGSQAINRKGFEVLRYFYDVSLSMEMEVDPNENDMTHCRYKCVAEMDGQAVEAWGTSHVDRGDDPWLLVEMAATRSRKRAISIATGAGAVAVAELRNEVEQ